MFYGVFQSELSVIRMTLYFELCFFFFKQKTAYEMRISDWSSDVCSSDLTAAPPTASTAAEADIGFTGIALNQPLLFSCARVHQRQGDIRFLLADLQSAQKSARSTTDQATQRTAEAKAAAVRILGHKVRHNEIIRGLHLRSEEHTSELQSLMRISYAVFCL